jgi:hypothetical protein
VRDTAFPQVNAGSATVRYGSKVWRMNLSVLTMIVLMVTLIFVGYAIHKISPATLRLRARVMQVEFDLEMKAPHRRSERPSSHRVEVLQGSPQAHEIRVVGR